ncbi:MFS transporter [Thermoflavimicrobium dichotomicum]|uniref:Predicted arabinose efflux permease, MFS family n=1 Tax=Thermoflavimicrobium dichotomicum TaxID=46223 RepID=A0A1I3RGA5_9BACL|nr:MFS transporter [Thermoflavimicrobium dichotomicum]SFJ45295.1 Predicted arabinose efflux permease, MFS family [Thermoflavimicrobium dichotomicum]
MQPKSFWKDYKLFAFLLANITSSIGSGITAIAIAWLIVKKPGGETIYGYTLLGVTLASFFLSPYIGTIIDRYSRKKYLLFTQLWGGSFVFSFAVYSFLTGDISIWQLIVLEIVGTLYWSLIFPGIFAFAHEIFHPDQYKKLNSLLEIQSQTASLLSAGFASLMITKVHISTILFIDTMTYVLGFLLILSIRYIPQIKNKAPQSMSHWTSMKEGFLYLKKIPWIAIFFISSLMPFIVVMVGNYLNPIHILSTLKADASAMGIAEALYAVGAALSGLFMAWLMNRWNMVSAIIFTVFLSFISTLLMALIPSLSLFLLLKVFKGVGNAGTRIVRNTVMMEIVPNHLMGRINSSINGVSLGIRVLLVFSFTQLIHMIGTQGSYFILSILLFISLISIYLSKTTILSALNKQPFANQASSSLS